MESVDSSFRDPSGYVFKFEGKFYRTVHNSYKHNLDLLESSGLYEKLLDRNQVLSYKHEEITKFDLDHDY